MVTTTENFHARKLKKRYDKVKIKVTGSKRVQINGAIAIEETPDVILISVDFKTKYAKVMCVIGTERGAEFFLEKDSSENKSNKQISYTILKFPEYIGWNVFSMNEITRYTLRLTLISPRLQ